MIEGKRHKEQALFARAEEPIHIREPQMSDYHVQDFWRQLKQLRVIVRRLRYKVKILQPGWKGRLKQGNRWVGYIWME